MVCPSLSSPRKEASCGGDDAASPDWSIFSGGGDGTVAHWSVIGLASEQEQRIGGAGEGGTAICKIGAYEVRLVFHLARGEGYVLVNTSAAETNNVRSGYLSIVGRPVV